MSTNTHREKFISMLSDRSMTVIYSGAFVHISQDAYYDFEVNRQFFYLTGLTRENMALVIKKCDGNTAVSLYIEESDPTHERWTGKMVTVDQATEISGIDDVRYIARIDADLHYLVQSGKYDQVYFDTYLHSKDDLPDYNMAKASEFAAKYPQIKVCNLHPLCAVLRRTKDEDEVAKISRAIDMTKCGLEQVMENLRPGMYEYQVQAEFEYRIFREGAQGPSFPTIAGAGANGTMLHYETNRALACDGDLILLDLGARTEGYCADITRTYPVNGKFTDRQRAYYDIVLEANRAVKAAARPGLTTRDLNEICKDVLAKGMIKLGKISSRDEIGKYYMHGVSHHLGIDVHDIDVFGTPLEAGCVITDEPGLYIDEEAIGIRIEDDLLITADGCVNLSAAIIEDADEIEKFMNK